MMNLMRSFGLTLTLLGALALGGCRSLENGSADMFAFLEGVPHEAKSLETMPLGDLACCASSGFQEYELGRRFETGTGGVSPDTECALYFYSEAGVQSVVVRQTNVQVGGRVDTTYLGLPSARLALKRLAADGHVLHVADYAKASQRCGDLKMSFYPRSGIPKPSVGTRS